LSLGGKSSENSTDLPDC